MRCEVCDRLVGFTEESLYYYVYCPECYIQKDGRDMVWMKKIFNRPPHIQETLNEKGEIIDRKLFY